MAQWAFQLQGWLCWHVMYSVPNSSSGTGPRLRVNRLLVYDYLHYWYMLIPVYSIRRIAAIPTPVRLQLLKKQLVQQTVDVSPNTRIQPCVHTVQQLYSLSNDYLFSICLLQLELSQGITDTAVIAVISTRPAMCSIVIHIILHS